MFRGDEVLTVVDEIEHDRRDLRSRLVAVRADGSGERELIGRSANAVDLGRRRRRRRRRSRCSRPTSASPASTSSRPASRLWLLEAGGPRRLTDAETIDLDEVGSHITAAGDDFLVQDRAAGRVRLLRVSRAGEVVEVLGGDVEVGGHAAAGERVVAAVATPDSLGELVLVEGGRHADAHIVRRAVCAEHHVRRS